jgi:hypothetical protein
VEVGGLFSGIIGGRLDAILGKSSLGHAMRTASQEVVVSRKANCVK